MLRRREVSLFCVGAAIWLASLGGAQAASSPWSVIASPNQGQGDNTLMAVTALGSTNAWAVGTAGDAPLIEHWNGTKWSVVASNAGVPGYLDSISADSATDVWASGGSFATGNSPLIEHWNGTAWSVLATNPPKAEQVEGISALSANSVWLEAETSDRQGDEFAWLEHWNGTKWSKHELQEADPDEGVGIYQVKAFSNTDVIAFYALFGNDAYIWDTARWTGSALNSFGAPDYSGDGGNDVNLMQMAASSPNNVWEVGQWAGYLGSSTTYAAGPAAGRWNGKAWHIKPVPTSYPDCCHVFNAVAPASQKSAWAVGYRSGTTGSDNLLEYWNGSTWAEYGGPNPTTSNQLWGVTTVPGAANSWWAVGTTGQGPAKTMILRCC